MENFLINVKKDSKRKLDAAEKIQKWFKNKKLQSKKIEITKKEEIIISPDKSKIIYDKEIVEQQSNNIEKIDDKHNFDIAPSNSIEIKTKDMTDMKIIEIENSEKEMLESFEKKEKEINLSLREEENSSAKLDIDEQFIMLQTDEETKKNDDEMEKAYLDTVDNEFLFKKSKL